MGQSYAYWLLSCRAADVQSNARMGGVFRSAEAVGQAVSYGLMSRNNVSALTGFIVNAALMLAAAPPTFWNASRVPRVEKTMSADDDLISPAEKRAATTTDDEDLTNAKKQDA